MKIKQLLHKILQNKKYQIILVMIIFGGIGLGAYLYDTYAATSSVSFSGNIAPSSTPATYQLNSGAGTMNVSIKTRSDDMNVSVTKDDGTVIGTLRSQSKRLASTQIAVQNGKYNFKVVNSSNKDRRVSFTVNISYPVEDSTVPSVSFATPISNATVKGTIALSANASDNNGVQKVDFLVDDGMVGSKNVSPYTVSWDSTKVTDGAHTITAKAYDISGNSSSVKINVNVKNLVDQPVSSDSPLPFTLAGNDTLKSSSKKVFAHYFSQFPIQISNEPAESDYYTRNYLSVTGENSKHAAYGGFLRERPLPQPLIGTNWELENMKTEVRRASEAGIDGFTYDMLSLSGQHWDRLKLLMQAANAVDPKFKIVLMPDANSGVSSDVNTLMSSIASIANDPSIYKLGDGRLVISPFYPDNAKTGAAYWSNFVSTMKSRHGVTVAFVPCFLNFGANVDAFNSFSYGFSNWGDRAAASNSASTLKSIADAAHARGKIWMQPVSLQDSRPNGGAYWEANNTENLRLTWDAAIKNAEWVQIPTWNDYSENASISPSTQIGWSPLDLNAYYLSRYKATSFPAISQDVIYLSHREHFTYSKPTGGQTLLQSIRGGTPRDKVEVLAFLKQPGTVEVIVGGVKSTVSAPAGVSSHLFDLREGSVSAKVLNGTTITASVSSPFVVTNAPAVQDLQYRFASSARSNGGLGHYTSSMQKR